MLLLSYYGITRKLELESYTLSRKVNILSRFLAKKLVHFYAHCGKLRNHYATKPFTHCLECTVDYLQCVKFGDAVLSLGRSTFSNLPRLNLVPIVDIKLSKSILLELILDIRPLSYVGTCEGGRET